MDWATIIPTVTAFALALAAIYRSVSEDRRKNQEKEDKRVDALTTGLQKQLDDALKRIDLLEDGKQKRDDQITKLRDERAKDILDYSKMSAEVTQLLEANQRLEKKQKEGDERQSKMQNELDALRQQNATLIEENDTLRQENAQLKTDNATIKADNTTIKAQLRAMITELKKANLPLPDGVENGEK